MFNGRRVNSTICTSSLYKEKIPTKNNKNLANSFQNQTPEPSISPLPVFTPEGTICLPFVRQSDSLSVCPLQI